jgi:hypothetical protein
MSSPIKLIFFVFLVFERMLFSFSAGTKNIPVRRGGRYIMNRGNLCPYAGAGVEEIEYDE